MRRIRFAIFATLVFPGAAFPQAGVATGEIVGVITDVTGARIAGVEVTATNALKGLSRSAFTDAFGRYRILSLPPDTYDVRVERTGFRAELENGVPVAVGQTTAIDLELELGEVVDAITVVAETSAIESQRVQQSNTIDASYIQNLPIDRRDYLTFALLAPGVADSDALADNADFRVTQTPQSGLSFFGNNGRGNSVTVDGAEANEAFGAVRATLSQEAVQEFQINRSNYSAELGGASGGVINIVSKSGSNQLHGSVFGFFRDSALDAGDPFAIQLQGNTPDRVKPPSSRQQYGGSVGFPLIRDRTFLYGAVERLRRDENSTVPILTDLSIFEPTADQSLILDSLAADSDPTPVPCLTGVPAASMLPPAACAVQLRDSLTSTQPTMDLFRTNSGVFPFRTSSTAVSFRIDHGFDDWNQLFVRYSLNDIEEDNRSTRALVGFSRSNNVSHFDSNVVAGWTHVFSSQLVGETRFQWNDRDFTVFPNEPNGPELNVAGFGFFNRDIFLPSRQEEQRYEVSHNLTLWSGNHLFKTGGSVLVRDEVATNQIFAGGRFNFGALPGSFISPQLAATLLTGVQTFDLGLPLFYQVGFGDPTVSSTIPFVAAYAQDSWRVSPSLTLNLGIRYEVDDRTDPLRTDMNNVAPRVGFAWSPGSEGKMVIRGGYGIYYSPIYYQIDYVVNAANEINGYRQIAQVLTTLTSAPPPAANSPVNIYRTLLSQGVIGIPDTTRPVTPDDLEQFGITISHSGPRPPLTFLFRHDDNYRNPYSQQASLGIERELKRGLTASINYTFVKTLKLTRARDINLLPRPPGPSGIVEWTAASGCTGAALFDCFRDPALLQENLYESSGRADYHGMTIEIGGEVTPRISLSGSYTLSKAIDDVTDYNSDFKAFDQTNLSLERSLSSFDQRHTVVFYASLQSPWLTAPGQGIVRNILSDFALTPIFRAHSGRPFNLLAGVDVNGDRSSTTDRPIFAGRNTGLGPDFWTLDLRITRRVDIGTEGWAMDLTAEAFNIFNRLNFSSVNNFVGANFGPLFRVEGRRDVGPSEPLGFSSAFEARRIQLGVRLSF